MTLNKELSTTNKYGRNIATNHHGNIRIFKNKIYNSFTNLHGGTNRGLKIQSVSLKSLALNYTSDFLLREGLAQTGLEEAVEPYLKIPSRHPRKSRIWLCYYYS
jgi:hypothetical protein